MSRRHSRAGRTTPRKNRVSRATAARAVTVTAILRGCTCSHPFKLDHGESDVAKVHHRDDCPALDSHGVVLFAAKEQP